MDRRPQRKIRILAVLFGILMIAIPIGIGSPLAAHANDLKAGDDVTVLAFTSDVHNAADNAAANRQRDWLDRMIDKYGRIDAMGFCGDMGSARAGESDFWTFSRAAMDVVEEKGIKDVYTTGNHEFYNGKFSETLDSIVDDYIVGGEGLVGDNYVIYCLGTDNWNDRKDNYTSDQVGKLRDYLSTADPEKPIIVLTHFPLHFYPGSWPRTTENADAIIDVLNEASDAGKNITLLWGHNHTLFDSNYDEVFLPGSTIECKSDLKKEINFRYAAAGCMSDSEYGTGSAYVKGKGLIITIDSKDQLEFNYYDAYGNNVTENDQDELAPEGDIYRLTDHLTEGKEYLIADLNRPGSGNALTNQGASVDGTNVGSTGVSIKKGDVDEDGTPDTYIRTKATNITWTTTDSGEGFDLTNNNAYLEGKDRTVKVFTAKQNADSYWNYANVQLLNVSGETTYTLYFTDQFTATNRPSGSRIYIYEKQEEQGDEGQEQTSEKTIVTPASEEGPAGTKYSPLKLRSIKQTKGSVTLRWNKVKGAKHFVLYGNKCGIKKKMKKLATVKGRSKTVNKIFGKKLKKGTYYKFMIVALDKNHRVISTSKVVHAATKGGKVGNYKRVSIRKSVLAKAKRLKKGKKLKLGAKAVSSGLIVRQHRPLSYESSDPKIAKVSKRGVVTAKKAGICYVYVYAQNGVSKAVKIKVK